MKVSFTGSQRGLTGRQWTKLLDLLRELKPSVVAHGGCIGADDAVDDLAVELGIFRAIFPSDHPTKALPFDHFVAKRGADRAGGGFTWAAVKAPLARNPDIVAVGELLIACPKEVREVIRSGTWATVRLARRVGKRVVVIDP